MNALLILIPVTLALAIVAVGIFFWAVRHDQFEDLDTPEILPLLDDPPVGHPGRQVTSIVACADDQHAPRDVHADS